MKILLDDLKKAKQKATTPKTYQGKQPVDALVKQGKGVTSIEITEDNIKSFEPYARKYGIDYALQKDSTETPPKWLVFFKAPDADVMTAAFREFTAKVVNRAAPQKPSLIAALKKAKELAASLVTDKEKHKDRGLSR